MSDENNSNEPIENVEPAEVETQAEEMIAKSAVSEIVKARVAREQKKHEAEKAELLAQIEKFKSQGKTKPQTKAKESEPDPMIAELHQTVQKLEQKLSEGERQAAFEKQLAGRKLPDGERENVYNAFDPENPDKVESWINAIAIKPDQQRPTVTASTGAPAGGPPDFNAQATSWSRDDIERLKSTGKFREAADKFFHAGSNGAVFKARNNKG